MKRISSHMEDYLEIIALLKKEKNVARVNDIGKLLHVKNSSVNAALATLSKNGLITHERYGAAELTAEGAMAAHNIQKRHNTIFNFLSKILEIEQKTAQADACKMEHTISPKTFERLAKFIQFAEMGFSGETPQWLKSFKHYLKTGKKLNCKMR